MLARLAPRVVLQGLSEEVMHGLLSDSHSEVQAVGSALLLQASVWLS